MNAHEIQNLTAVVGATKRADDSIGKLFDEADCDGEAAAILAGASEKIEYVLLSAVYPLTALVCIACSGSETAKRTRGKTGCMAIRPAARRDCHAAAHGETVKARRPCGGRAAHSKTAARNHQVARILSGGRRGALKKLRALVARQAAAILRLMNPPPTRAAARRRLRPPARRPAAATGYDRMVRTRRGTR